MSEELIIRHCSPTLAGIKAGSMFCYSFTSFTALKNDLRRINRMLGSKGLRVLPLKFTENTALIYFYRPSKLREALSCSDAESLLKCHGYPCHSPERSVTKLMSRIRSCEDFPHEIGLFLGYPPEDVRGFIENNAKASKLTGYWRVYGNEENAKKTFAKYRKCTETYVRQLNKGNSLYKLTVAV